MSAKTGTCVNEAFETVVRSAFENARKTVNSIRTEGNGKYLIF